MATSRQKQRDEELAKAIRFFWRTRTAAAKKQATTGKQDQGSRSAVTAGKNMDGFVNLMAKLAKKNGPKGIEICTRSSNLVLPGYFRATKMWDVVLMHQGELVAAIELKSR